MKISYITRSIASNQDSYSGTDYFIGKNLKEHGFEVEFIDNLPTYPKIFCKLIQYFSKILFKKNVVCDYNPFVCKVIALYIQKRISNDSDVVLSTNSILLAYVKTNKKKVFWTDATFAGLLNFYPDFSNLIKFSENNGQIVESRALNNVDLAIYSSDWAANSAFNNYIFDFKKVRMIPYGCNIDKRRQVPNIDNINNKQFEVCKLLFVGKEWERKGGEYVLKVVNSLQKMNVKTELSILGCKPIFDKNNRPSNINELGFISKNTLEGQELINLHYSEAHFLIILPNAECAAMVFAEANSFCLPVISTNVGGISTVVKDEINGKLFELNTEPDLIASYIKNVFHNKVKYKKLAISAKNYFNSNLNWDYAVQKLKDNLSNEI